MTTVMNRMSVFASQAGRNVRIAHVGSVDGDVAAFVSAPNRRAVVSIVTGRFSVDVTFEGLTRALDEVWVEPSGWATMRVADDQSGRRWFVVELDSDPHPDLKLQFDADQVGAFIADVLLAICYDDAVTRGGAA